MYKFYVYNANGKFTSSFEHEDREAALSEAEQEARDIGGSWEEIIDQS